MILEPLSIRKSFPAHFQVLMPLTNLKVIRHMNQAMSQLLEEDRKASHLDDSQRSWKRRHFVVQNLAFRPRSVCF